jgi:hypothetical protein
MVIVAGLLKWVHQVRMDIGPVARKLLNSWGGAKSSALKL